MFFKEFPTVGYNFGTETGFNQFQNISAYVDIIDDIKDDISFYQYYNILDKRPDQVSYELYGNVNFYWTFFLLNDNLRRQGWPIRELDYQNWVVNKYNKKVITTKDSLDVGFRQGDTVTGFGSGATGIIRKRNEDLGQLFISSEINFEANELVQDVNGNIITVDTAVPEYNAVKYYLDPNGDFVDINPADGPGQLYTAVTFSDHLKNELDNLRNIKVIKPEAINAIVIAFKEALRS
jgi:hypothetical protein